jgi:phosphotransferase system enzyme I (PtsI)
MRRTSVVLDGKAVSEGIAVGVARIHIDDPSVVPAYCLLSDEDTAPEIEAFHAALAEADREAAADVDWAKRNLPASEAEIFTAQRAILHDPTLVEWIEDRIRSERVNAAQAVRKRFDEFRAILQESASEIIRNRIQDVTDAENLILSHLLHRPRRGSGAEESRTMSGREPAVLVAQNPLPSLLARTDPETIAGIACEGGGGMGHVAVLARALGLPALIQVEGLLSQVREGDLLAVDADEGKVIINPSGNQLDQVRIREHKSRLLRPPAPTDPRSQRRTADGLRIRLSGNVSSQRDVDVAAQIDADGIGLYRTEYLYLAKQRLPTENELAETYSAAACSFTRDPVDIRLLDLGSDRRLPWAQFPSERNPALGLRSLRFLYENESILRTQIRAVLQAAADGPVRLLLPMVSGVEDVRRIRGLVSCYHEELRREGIRHNPDLAVGAMIEHPAGVTMAPEIFREADFISVGTNDLAMYMLAVDRDASHMASYYDPLHPALIRTLKGLTELADRTGKSLSICGEIAGDPTLTGFLVGLGLTRLSMAPQWILPVGLVLASIDAAEWTSLADRAAQAATPDEVRGLLRELQESG